MSTMSGERRSTGRAVARGAGLALLYAVVGLVVSLVSVFVALSALDAGDEGVQRALVLRAVLVAVLLAVVTLFSDRDRPLVQLLGIALAGYAINPMTWQGRAFLGQLWFEPGLATILVDGVAWLAIVGVAGWAVRAARRR